MMKRRLAEGFKMDRHREKLGKPFHSWNLFTQVGSA
jgi:hypothetical protein